MAKRKSNYKEILAKAKADKQIDELRGNIANASIEDLRVAVLAATLEVIGIGTDLILEIADKETAGAYLLRAAYISAADLNVGGFNRDDMIEMFNAPIEGDAYDAKEKSG